MSAASTRAPAERKSAATIRAIPTVPSAATIRAPTANVLIVDDSKMTEDALRTMFNCDRITHMELITSSGTEYTGKILRGDFQLLWIVSPLNWYARIPTQKSLSHWQRVILWITKMHAMERPFVLFGPPGFLWKISQMQDLLNNCAAQQRKIRFCALDIKFDSTNPQPSGSYMNLAATLPINNQWRCKCNIPIPEHTLDWYGRHPQHTEWRKQATAKCHASAIQAIPLHKIADFGPSPLPTLMTSSKIFPTDARIRQKERLKAMKEQGLKPKKKKVYVEPGDDDCGEDLSGLGKDIQMFMLDVYCEDLEESDQDDSFVPIPHGQDHLEITYLTQHKTTVDILELCGGTGRISETAFRRGLTSGGNLDLTTGCDLGDPQTQRALMHYLDTNRVFFIIMSPNCRTISKLASVNKALHPDTVKQHQREDRPHLVFCAKVAQYQHSKGLYFAKESPAGNSMEQDILEWRKVSQLPRVQKCLQDQCMTGQADSHGTLVRKRTEWTSNSDAFIDVMSKLQCDNSHQHANPTGKELNATKQYTWKMCSSIVKGVQKQLELEHSKPASAPKKSVTFPTVSTSTDTLPPVLD